nr:hypothetical protein [Tanacetum cinerariifolium]
KDIDVYLRPLIDDLKVLWALKCVVTIDVATGQKFNMRAMVLWTINDFLAQSSLSGWIGHDERRTTQKSGICSPDGKDEEMYYGQLQEILEGVIVVEEDPDVIHFDNSPDLPLSTSLNDLDNTILHIDGQSTEIRQRHVDNDPGVCATSELFALTCGLTPTLISVNSCVVNGVRFFVHSRDERRTTQKSGICSPDGKDEEMYYGQLQEILEFRICRSKLCCSKLSGLTLATKDMSANVVRGHGDDGGADDHPPTHHIPTDCKGCFINQGKGTRKPNLGRRKAGRLHTRQESQNLVLKKITDDKGPVPIRFEWDGKKTLMPLSEHVSHWSNYLGELIREQKTAIATKIEFFQHVFPTMKGYKLPPSYYTIKKIFKTIELSHTAKEMNWHATRKCTKPGKMQHPVDGRAWKNIKTKYLNFAKEPRNVQLGLDADCFNPFGNLSQAYNMWLTKRSIFNELEYWSFHTLKHNLDIMHIEKNMLESILNTLLMNDKSKDTTKVRQDLKRLGIRSGLWLGQTKNKKCSKPQAAYSFSAENRKKFCQFIKGVKLPDGFGSNFKHKVTDNDTNKMGLKSHDCHIMMQCLLPYGLQQYLPDEVAKSIIELCSFFKQICSVTLMEDDMLKAQSKVVDILCNLKLIYPLTFFDIMIHLFIHLPLEDLEGGPIRPRGVIVVEEDPDVIHFDNSPDLPLSTSLNELDNTTLHIDGQSIKVDATPDIIDLDEDDDIIDDEDALPHDLADSEDDGVDMSANVARGYGGNGGGDDRPPTHHILTGCEGCFINRGKGTRKPNLGRRKAGRLHTR